MLVLWKSIPGYEGIYEISNTGLVRGRKGIRKILVSWDGYQYVKLCNRGREKKFKVHRLVAMAFIPNPNGLPEINHKNEVKTDNRVENLEWCSRKYNNNHGTRNQRAGESIRRAKQFRVYRYGKDGKYIDSYESAKVAGEIFNCSPSWIAAVARGKGKMAGGYIWKYSAKGQPINNNKQ